MMGMYPNSSVQIVEFLIFGKTCFVNISFFFKYEMEVKWKLSKSDRLNTKRYLLEVTMSIGPGEGTLKGY